LAFCILAQIWPKNGPDLAHGIWRFDLLTVGCWPTEDLSDENKNSERENVAVSILSGSNAAPI
jgi:hypothetical protein